jgi:branched-chain amino acid transport system permease protein
MQPAAFAQLPTLDVFLQQLANGLTVGSLYALVAAGYTMVYGILRFINFAHSDIFMMAMYFAYFLISVFMLPWYFAFIVVVILTTFLGILLERAAYRPLRKQNAPKISMLISAIGASYLLENLATVLFTGRPKNFPQIPLFTDMVVLGTVRIQKLALMVPVITLVIALVMILIISHTRSGMAMRAVAKDIDTARLMGIDVNRTISFTFAVGSSAAGVGAIMWGFKYIQISPMLGVMPGMKCFIAAVIGGIGNVKGAILGGVLLGLMEIMLITFFPSVTNYKDVFSFVLLIVILLFKPNGLISEKIIKKV